MRVLIILFVLFSMISCNKFKKKDSDEYANFKKDTFYSNGNEIIFFLPSENFLQNKLNDFEGIEETDSDFRYYSSEVYNDLKTNVTSISTNITKNRFLAVIDFKNDTIIIDRYKDSLYFGTLLNFKNRDFIIKEGVFSDADFFPVSIIEEIRIDFNLSPVTTKEITLNDKDFWVTSSMEGNKRKDTICKYKDYWLRRTYNVISKNNNKRNKIVVFVADDNNKWNGEKAVEIFKSLIILDDSIKVWDSIYVGMTSEELINLIKLENYKKDEDKITLSSQVFKSTFYFNKENIISKIKIVRNCE